MPSNPIAVQLERLFADAAALRGDGRLRARFDPAFRSDCEVAVDDSGDYVFWRPARQSPPVDFSGLGNAIEAPVHPDITRYYGSFWAGAIEAETTEGRVSLIQLWNAEDFDRLVANLVGHYLAKRRAKSPFTVFFANTEPDSELFLSIDNEQGSVLLEEPGRVVREVEADIATFLARVTPVDEEPGLY